MFLFINTALKTSQVYFGDFVSRHEVEREFPGGAKSEADFYNALQEVRGVDEFEEKLEGIVTVSGPGPFTALRLGMCAANTVAFLFNKPVTGIETFKWLNLVNPDTSEPNVVLPAGGSMAHRFIRGKHDIVNIQEIDKSKKYLGYLQGNNNDITFVEDSTLAQQINRAGLQILDYINESSGNRQVSVMPWYAKSVL